MDERIDLRRLEVWVFILSDNVQKIGMQHIAQNGIQPEE